MADLKFSQPERSNFLFPGLIVLALVAAAIFLYLRPASRVADVVVTHTAVLPTHTVFASGSKVVGSEHLIEDELYVLATVRVTDTLGIPIFIKDLTGTLTASDGSATTTSAVEKNDLDSLYVTFPKLKPLATAPLLRETRITPGQTAEGMVLLHFPVAPDAWNQRKSAAITIDLYHQPTLTVTIPKS